jgi:hypothetical protein
MAGKVLAENLTQFSEDLQQPGPAFFSQLAGALHFANSWPEKAAVDRLPASGGCEPAVGVPSAPELASIPVLFRLGENRPPPALKDNTGVRCWPVRMAFFLIRLGVPSRRFGCRCRPSIAQFTAKPGGQLNRPQLSVILLER